MNHAFPPCCHDRSSGFDQPVSRTIETNPQARGITRHVVRRTLISFSEMAIWGRAKVLQGPRFVLEIIVMAPDR